jgi:hypothetical protein
MRMRRITAAVTTGLVALVIGIGVAPAPALAASGWDLTHTVGDQAGAWAYGSYWWGGDGRLYVKVNVKDTIANGKNASVKLTAYYTGGDPRHESLTNNNGAGTTVTNTWDFRGDVSAIWGIECIDNSTSLQDCAAGWKRIY